MASRPARSSTPGSIDLVRVRSAEAVREAGRRDLRVLPQATGHGARQRLHDSLRTILRIGRKDGSIRSDVTLNDVIYFETMLATPFHGSSDQRRIVRRQKSIHLDGLAGPRMREGGTLRC